MLKILVTGNKIYDHVFCSKFNQYINCFLDQYNLLTHFYHIIFFGHKIMTVNCLQDLFNFRFMGALTCLLVLASLLATIEENLPKTSYFKVLNIKKLLHIPSVKSLHNKIFYELFNLFFR